MIFCIILMLSSHQRRFDGALKRCAKRHQSVTKLALSGRVVIDRGKAWSKAGHSARAPFFLNCLYLVHTNGECRALNQRAKRRHFCLLFQIYHDLLSNVTL